MLHLFCQIKFIDAVLKIILSLLFEFTDIFFINKDIKVLIIYTLV